MLLAVGKATGEQWACVPRIASGLGGGMAGQGEACGALTGGVMLVGLLHGNDDPGDEATRTRVKNLAASYVRRFAEANGALRCRDILELDISTSEGLEEYRARNLGEERCFGVVRNAVGGILKLLKEEAAV